MAALFYRDVAQLVAHYVRDVGVARSSRVIPTKDSQVAVFLLFGHRVSDWNHRATNLDLSIDWNIRYAF